MVSTRVLLTGFRFRLCVCACVPGCNQFAKVNSIIAPGRLFPRHFTAGCLTSCHHHQNSPRGGLSPQQASPFPSFSNSLLRIWSHDLNNFPRAPHPVSTNSFPRPPPPLKARHHEIVTRNSHDVFFFCVQSLVFVFYRFVRPTLSVTFPTNTVDGCPD